jgi:hypothetical protein
MSSLIQDIAGEVSKSLDGKDFSDINPIDLMSSLMSGNSNVNGVDFSCIIKNITEKLQTKFDSGEIDTNKLKEQAENLLENPIINKLITSSQIKK